MYVRFGGGFTETCCREAARRWAATLLKILITVVLGAAILAILNTAVPGLFTSMVNKISSEWTNVTILPN